MAKSEKYSQFNFEFPTIDKCDSIGRENHTVVSDLNGTLLRGCSSSPYRTLLFVAYESGGILRLLFLLSASPLAITLYYLISEAAGISVVIFATFTGMKISDIESVARTVLPRLYWSDLHPEAWRVFSSCGNRCVLTATPRLMVEPFSKEYLGAKLVLGTEIDSYRGRATGLVRDPGVLVGRNKFHAFLKAFRDVPTPELGLGDRKTDYPYMKLCKESYIVRPVMVKGKAATPVKLPNPSGYRNGWAMKKLIPQAGLSTIFWIPVGLLLASIRLVARAFLQDPG